MEEHRSGDAVERGALSVVIPTHDRSRLLRQTVEHLMAGQLTVPWEIVVVANACSDDTASVVAELAAGAAVPLRLVEEARPSASVARNRGAQAAAGPLLLFLDDDILLQGDGLATIAEWYLRSDGSSLLVGQVLALPEHVATPFGSFRQRHAGEVAPGAGPHDVDWFASGLAAVPATTFAALGGYTERYPAAGLEDADFAIRARRAGHRIIFHPGVAGLHNDWAGTTARDYCRRAAAYCATAPLLAERFPDNDHPWGRTVEVNRPPAAGDPRSVRVRKRMKQAAVAASADRWLPAAADRLPLPRQPRELLYRASVSVASYAGYQAGLRRLAATATTTTGDGVVLPEARAALRSGKREAHGLSIVIVTFNCGDEVVRAVESLRRHPPSVSHEIVVIDNASADGTVGRLRRLFPDVTVIPLDENVGYGSAVNLAVKETDGRHLLLLNPDTEVTDGAVDLLLQVAATTPGVGVVGPRLLLAGGDPQISARRFPSPWRLWPEVLRLHLLLPRRVRHRLGASSGQDRRGRVDWVSGACHLVPRPVWDELGGLTERTFCGFDDLDFCWRARRSGYDTWFCPGAVVLHHCGVSVSRRWTEREIDALAIHNIYVLLEGHWSRFRVKAYCAAELVGTASDLLVGPWLHRLAGSEAAAFRAAAADRLRLLTGLLLGRIRPIERHQPGVGVTGGARTAVARQPLLHRAAWRLGESGLRGKSRIGGVLRRGARAPTGLVRLPNGQVLRHDPSDHVAHTIYLGGYEPAERRIFRQLVRPNGLVVDVGANLGIYTLAASELVGPAGRVIAIEPGPALEGLRVAVDAARCGNVEIVPVAAGAAAGRAVLHVPGHHAGLASLRTTCAKSDPQVVEVARLDALPGLPAGEIDVLKVDTEGYEAEVLAGAEGWLRDRRVRAILVEVSPEFGGVGFVGAIARQHDFAIFRIGYRRGLWYRPELQPATAAQVERETTQANYLLLRSDVRRDRPLSRLMRR